MKIKYSLITLAVLSMAAEAQMVPAIDKGATADFVAPTPKKNLQLSEKERYALQIAREWKDMPNKPRRSADGSVKYLYGTTLPTLICKPLQVCVINLQAGESVNENGVHVGDPRWLNSPALSGSRSGSVTHIILKPTDYGLPTNMVITTDRRVYTIKLVAANNEWMPFLSFDYPEDNEMAWSTYRANQSRVANATTLRTGEDVGNLDFKFTMSGDSPAWKPERVYRDRRGKTHIQFSSANFFSGAPLLVVIGKGGGVWSKANPQAVNYRPIGDTYVVDGQPDHMALIMGVGDEETKVDIKYTGGKKE